MDKKKRMQHEWTTSRLKKGDKDAMRMKRKWIETGDKDRK